jgi:virulence-associated protein VagC
MKTVSLIESKVNICNLFDEVLRTGMPIEIDKQGKKLIIMPSGKTKKLQNLVLRPDAIKGNPDELVDITWEKEMSFDLP